MSVAELLLWVVVVLVIIACILTFIDVIQGPVIFLKGIVVGYKYVPAEAMSGFGLGADGSYMASDFIPAQVQVKVMMLEGDEEYRELLMPASKETTQLTNGTRVYYNLHTGYFTGIKYKEGFIKFN